MTKHDTAKSDFFSEDLRCRSESHPQEAVMQEILLKFERIGKRIR